MDIQQNVWEVGGYKNGELHCIQRRKRSQICDLYLSFTVLWALFLDLNIPTAWVEKTDASNYF